MRKVWAAWVVVLLVALPAHGSEAGQHADPSRSRPVRGRRWSKPIRLPARPATPSTRASSLVNRKTAQLGLAPHAVAGSMQFSYTIRHQCAAFTPTCIATADFATVSTLPGGTVVARRLADLDRGADDHDPGRRRDRAVQGREGNDLDQPELDETERLHPDAALTTYREKNALTHRRFSWYRPRWLENGDPGHAARAFSSGGGKRQSGRVLLLIGHARAPASARSGNTLRRRGASCTSTSRTRRPAMRCST